MAGNSQNITRNIIVNGSVTTGFQNLARQISNLGQTVNQISGYILEFEDDSLDIYRNYEDHMLSAEYALTSQYESATKLAEVMDGLDKAAQEWASTSIFHTNDVSAAIEKAAHAGWNYEEILTGIPKAMQIAQAGGLELTEGLDYLVKMAKATSTEFEDMGPLIDQWAKAANMSATDIGEMGDAFMALSSSAMFADNTQELFTMMAVLADTGVTGSRAGTMLRNAMLRIVAPTDKARKTMDGLKYTYEDLMDFEELEEMDAQYGEGLEETFKKIGFSAYDAQGNLKPMYDIFMELRASLKGLDEDIQFDILRRIFPSRSISAAMSLFNAIDKGDFQKKFMMIGNSEGYAAKGADIMMSGLTGAVETLLSKWEEFKRSVGEQLAPVVENLAGSLGRVVDYMNEMDEPSKSALVGALTALAQMGPTLMFAGTALELIASHPVATSLMLLTMAAGALAGYMDEVSRINYEQAFGNVVVNLDLVAKDVETIGTKFNNEKRIMTQWESKLKEAANTYKETNTELSELMFQDVLAGKVLGPVDKEKLETYAGSVYKAVVDGINASKDANFTFLELMFGDSPSDSRVFTTSTDVMEFYFSGAMAQAQELGQQLRDKMTAALQDDMLDAAELKAIQATQDRLNRIMADIQFGKNSQGYYVQLSKSQNLSAGTVKDFVNQNKTVMDEELAGINSTYDQYVGVIGAAYDYALKNGAKTYMSLGLERMVTEDDLNAALTEIERERQEAIRDVYSKYDDLNLRAIDMLMHGSDYGEYWDILWNSDFIKGKPDLAYSLNGKSLEDIKNLAEQWDEFNVLFNEVLKNANAKESFGSESYDYLNMMNNASGQIEAYSEIIKLMEETGWDVLPSPEVVKRYQALSQQKTGIQDDLAFEKSRLQEVESLIKKYENIYNRPENKWLNQAAYNEAYNWLYSDFGLYGERDILKKGIEELESQLKDVDAKITLTLDTSEIDNYQPPTWYGDVVYRRISEYASGGRATQASIFGEAGPEWAIPEEHSERTAALLDAARRASGFSWGDLIARYGGLNADPYHQGVVLNYSPTINAGNAEGVTEALERDRDSLTRLVRRAVEEAQYRDRVNAFA